MAARKPKSQARRNGSRGMPGWMWLAIGLVLGALGFAAWNLRDRWQGPEGLLPRPDPQAQAAPTPESAEPVLPEAAVKPKPKFEFYEVLAEREVVIPDAELAEQARAEAQAAASPAPPAEAPAADGPSFLIQAGAFRSSDDAEALKARIALTGELARVEPAQINGVTVYRVRMGPYPNASALSAAKQALSSHGIDGAQALSVK